MRGGQQKLCVKKYRHWRRLHRHWQVLSFYEAQQPLCPLFACPLGEIHKKEKKRLKRVQPFVDTEAGAAVASAIWTSLSSSLSSDSELDSESEADSSLSDELSFLSFVTPGSGSEDLSSSDSDSLPGSADLGIGFETGLDAASSSSELSSEDSSLELSFGLAMAFAGELLVVEAGTFADFVEAET